MPEQIDFDPTANYYEALGVTEKSSADEVKKAYRTLAKQYHPDSTGGDKAKESKFKTISVAYDVIGNPKRRELYDRVRVSSSPISNIGIDGSGLSELFHQFFGQQDANGGSWAAFRTADFVESKRHAGRAAPSPKSSPKQRPAPAPEPVRDVCASDGSSLRVDGFDVHSDVTISFDRAILGTTVTVVTIDGKADVKIPAGSSSGRKLRLRGKGVFNPGGFTGDHHVTVQIEVPGELDDEATLLVVQLAAKLKKLKKQRA